MPGMAEAPTAEGEQCSLREQLLRTQTRLQEMQAARRMFFFRIKGREFSPPIYLREDGHRDYLFGDSLQVPCTSGEKRFGTSP